MQYKPKSVAALHVALGSLPDKMRVQVDSDIGLSAKTVGQLRKRELTSYCAADIKFVHLLT